MALVCSEYEHSMAFVGGGGQKFFHTTGRNIYNGGERQTLLRGAVGCGWKGQANLHILLEVINLVPFESLGTCTGPRIGGHFCNRKDMANF